MPSKINIIVRLQNWMDSVPGQTFLNYAYSWGASIVILGALFKLTHIQGGNIMLFIGMGTEVIVFFLSAFDRPFDKAEVGKELPEDLETDEEMATRMGLTDDEEDIDPQAAEAASIAEAQAWQGEPLVSPHMPSVSDTPRTVIRTPGADDEAGLPGETMSGVECAASIATQGIPVSGGQTVVPAGGTIVIGGSVPGAAGAVAQSNDGSVEAVAAAAVAAATPNGEQPFENEAQHLAQIIRLANDELLRRAQAVLSPDMEAATQTYIEKLQTLAETFAKVDEQSARLAKDSEEMQNLNRTLTGINKVYELHLKSISLQVGTIDQINEQTQKLAQQIEDLNRVYGRMIEALTVNMRGKTGVE